MKYRSTRGSGSQLSVSQAINQGLAKDGGLYVPVEWPEFKVSDFDGLETIGDIATRMLEPFFEGDELAGELSDICHEALNFAVPTRVLGRGLGVLELFHGPTSAFKDIGARFLSACMQRIETRNTGDDRRPLNILVATSGDTGGAVAAAFDGIAGINVMVLFPKGLVSPRQAHQLCCWSKNVISLSVKGRFDDCQALVKKAFSDPGFSSSHRLTSANSISIGRLLPQMTYYALASLQHWRESGDKANFIIPAGNVGNSLACLWARKLGLPIGEVRLAVNANRTIPDFLETGEWLPRESVATLASAMDVGNPSNMERMRNLHPEHADLGSNLSASSVTDDQIRAQIVRTKQHFGQVICPHTATAFHVYHELSDEERAKGWILVSTAHPAKFNDIVDPLVGESVAMPPALAALMERPAHSAEITPELDKLADQMPD